MTIYHYTIKDRLKSILKDGFIKQATVGVPAGIKTVVWFSIREGYEPTAKKSIYDGVTGKCRIATTEEMKKIGCVRIVVDEETAPHDWNAYKRLSGVNRKFARALYSSAIGWGSRPGQWRVSFEPVPREKWVRIEILENGIWREIEEGDLE